MNAVSKWLMECCHLLVMQIIHVAEELLGNFLNWKYPAWKSIILFVLCRPILSALIFNMFAMFNAFHIMCRTSLFEILWLLYFLLKRESIAATVILAAAEALEVQFGHLNTKGQILHSAVLRRGHSLKSMCKCSRVNLTPTVKRMELNFDRTRFSKPHIAILGHQCKSNHSSQVFNGRRGKKPTTHSNNNQEKANHQNTWFSTAIYPMSSWSKNATILVW